MDAFVDYAKSLADPNSHDEHKKFHDTVDRYCLLFLILGGAIFTLAYLQISSWMLSGKDGGASQTREREKQLKVSTHLKRFVK